MPKKLLQKFTTSFFPNNYQKPDSLMQGLVSEGQNPEYFIISCADSRSDPAVIFNSDPGVFFGFKSIGAIVRPYKTGTALAASLQFAIKYLNVKKIILIGHTQCGAIKALHDRTDDPEIASFIDVAHNAMDKAHTLYDGENKEELLRIAEKQVVLASTENLKTYPSVAQALAENCMTIESWIFEMHSGNILRYSNKKGEFFPATDNEAPISNTSSCC